MQVLEPPTSSQIKVSGDYAGGFLISTRETAPAPQGRFRINKDAGHAIAQTFKGTHFMIDHQLLDNQDDGHFYGHGLDALLEGYRKKSHGVIERVKGPFYYPDDSGDYWYEFDMKLRDSGAAAALQRYGAQSWEPFAVSPHIWDYPELQQDPLNLIKARGVGVALVMKGAFGNQAVITRFCKGTSDHCYSNKGLGAVLKQECSAGCFCAVCQNEDSQLAQLITSHLGKSGSSGLNIILEPSSNFGKVTDPSNPKLDMIPSTSSSPTLESQLAITEAAKSKEAMAKELEEYKQKAREEAEKVWKDQVIALQNKDKMRTLNEIFSKELIPDENARKVVIDKHQTLDNVTIDHIKAALEDYRPHLEAQFKKKKAETERPEGDEENPESGDNPEGSKKSSTATTEVTIKKGKSGSEQLPAEPSKPKHPLPNKEEEAGKAASTDDGVNQLQMLRNGMMSRRLV